MGTPFFICLFQSFEGGLFIRSRVYAAKILGKEFHVLMRYIFQGIAYHVYDAALMLRFRKGRLYRFLEPAEPVRAKDKNILNPSIF